MSRRLRRLGLVLLVATVAYLAGWPVPLRPVAWEPPTDAGLVGAFAPNDRLAAVHPLSMGSHWGPEDAAVRADGTVFVSSQGGDILRLEGETLVPWVNTGGRPLGLEFDATGRLLVADAYRGLLAITPGGEISVLASTVEGAPVRFADDVDVGPDGTIYFTDASAHFGAAEWGGPLAASVLDTIEHDGSGRLIEYDPKTGGARVLLGGVHFANGVAVSADGDAVFVCETGSYRVLEYTLRGPGAGGVRPLVENLPGFPDNIARGADGRLWVGLISPRDRLLDALSGWPRIREALPRMPEALRPAPVRYGHLIAVDAARGTILQSLQDPTGGVAMVTGAVEAGGQLFVTSLTAPSLGRLPLRAALGE